MYGYIYKTTNLINGKIYIGQHKHKTFDSNYFGSGVLISESINKYGKNNFSVELIEWCESLDALNEKEKYYIELYNTKDSKIGYNLADGGAIHLSDEYLMSIRDELSHKGNENPNARYSLEQCNEVKRLLDAGESIHSVQLKTGVSVGVIQKIRSGIHYSCYVDNYKCKLKRPTNINKSKRSKLTDEEKAQRKKENREKFKQQKEVVFLSTNHYCMQCGKLITKLVGSGKFCCKKCGSIYGALHRDNTNILNSIKNRDYKGENNPNFGRKADDELRQKISNNIKNSIKFKNVKESPRFKGKRHSEEAKEKISNTIKRTLEGKRNNEK